MNRATVNKDIPLNINFTSDKHNNPLSHLSHLSPLHQPLPLPLPVLKLDGILNIDTVPFIWHREHHITCPINSILRISPEIMTKYIEYYDKDIQTNNLEECYIVSQETVLIDANYYVALHSFLYRILHDSKDDVLQVSKKYRINTKFNYSFVPLSDGFEEVNRSPFNKINKGSVFIHDHSFSPPGCIHFKLDHKEHHYILLFDAICTHNNKRVTVIFFIINSNLNIKLKNDIGSYVNKIIDNAIHKIIHPEPIKCFLKYLNSTKEMYSSENQLIIDKINQSTKS